MFLWSVHFETVGGLVSLPRLRVVASEIQHDASYHLEGARRRREAHSLFKYTLDGEGVFRDAAGEHRLPPGRGFLTRISDPQTAYYFPPDARGPWTFVWMIFDGPAANALVDEMVGRWGHIYRLPRGSAAVNQMMAFGPAGRARQEITGAEGSQVVMNLLLELGRSSESGRREDPGSLLVRRARRAVVEHLERGVNASALAGLLDVSREHLSRAFRAQTGMSPYRYICRQRILRACRLLSETALSAKEVAARLGYANPAHFARSFKSLVGVTPGEFRASGMMIPVL